MLQTIRDKTQGWIATVIIAVVCLTFALWGVHYYLQGNNQTTTYVAKVNGKQITAQQFTQAYQLMQQQQQQILGANYSNDAQVQDAIKHTILKQLIEQTLLTQDLEKQHYSVSNTDVTDMIVNLPAFQEEGQFSQVRFNQILQLSGFTPQQFYEQIQEHLLIGQLSLGLANSNYALPADIKAAVMLLNETRDVGFMVLPLQTFVNQVTLNEQEIKSYYAAHQNDFKMPEQIQLQYILLPPHNQIKGMNFSAQVDALTNLTYESPNTLEVAAKKLQLPIQTTDYFTEKNPPKTGILASPEIVKAAFSDEVYHQSYNSTVITLADGSQVVIRLAAKKPAAIRPLSEVEDSIKNRLTKEMATAAMQKEGEHIAQQLSTNANPTELALASKTTWHEKKNVNRHEENVNPKVLETVFNMYVPVDKLHPTTRTILLPNGNLAVVAFYAVNFGNINDMTQDQLRIFSRQIAIDYGKIDYALYLRSLKQDAKITYNKSALDVQ